MLRPGQRVCAKVDQVEMQRGVVVDMPCMNKPCLGGSVGSMPDGACMPAVVSEDVVHVGAPRVRACRESLGKGGHDVTRGLFAKRAR